MRMGSADKRRLRRKFDIRDVVFCATIRQYIWYGDLSRKTYNEVDRAFYEPIISWNSKVLPPLHL